MKQKLEFTSNKGGQIASYMAEQLCVGFIQQDMENREASLRAFKNVDILQFAHISDEMAHRAAEAYVDALWAKERIEHECMVGGELDRDRLAAADWSEVEAALERRAEAAGIDRKYAELTTEAWFNHKLDKEDYWTPMQHAQMLELRAALQDPSYPDKPRHGMGGFGPEPARYSLGNELHDCRQWTKAKEAMTPYFQRILDERDDWNVDPPLF